MIYFLTVNYYSADLIKNLLASLMAVDYHPEYHLLIVNNSPDDTAINTLPVDFSIPITVINAGQNLGFAAGCNLGIEYVYKLNSQALIWLINPDTTLENIAISYILECFTQKPNIAILGTRIRDTQGNIWFNHGTFNPWLGSLKHGDTRIVIENIENGEKNLDKTINSRWVSGCSLILNLSNFNHCPKFDEGYFLYYEDNDFCERYYKIGYAIAVTKAVLVNHAVSAISGKDSYTKFLHATYSKLYFLKQHGTLLSLGLNLIYMLFLIVKLWSKNRQAALGRWQGLQKFTRFYLKVLFKGFI